VCVRERVCVYERERECVCERERETPPLAATARTPVARDSPASVCVGERESECVCVCLCVRASERQSGATAICSHSPYARVPRPSPLAPPLSPGSRSPYGRARAPGWQGVVAPAPQAGWSKGVDKVRDTVPLSSEYGTHKPVYGLCFQAKSLETFYGVRSPLGSGALERFRGGLVLKAHRLVYHSTLVLRVIKQKKKGHVRRVRARPRGRVEQGP